MKHLKLFEDYIMESHDLDRESIEIDGYIIHDDDIKDIFSSLYDDIPQLKYAEISFKDSSYFTYNFKVTFFIDRNKVDDDKDWFDRFFQTFPQYTKSGRQPKDLYNDKDILNDIDTKMRNKFGYKLSGSSKCYYNDRIGKEGYCLDFNFEKYETT